MVAAPLAPARPGQRWSIRVRLPDGSATDVVGWVERLTDDAVSVSGHDGRLHRLDLGTVLAARRAPAALGGPDPRRVGAAELEQLTVPAWLALSEPLGKWTLRAGGDFTLRANSCHAVGDPGMPVPEAAARIVAYAAAHRITPRASVVRGSAEEQALRDLGWTDRDVEVDVLTVRLADLLAGRDRDPRVQVSERLDPAWWAAFGRSRPNRCDPALLRMILDGRPPRAFGSVPGGGGEATAIGRGHLSGDWVGVAALWTDPDHRRRGWATALVVALGHWAARRNARYCYLQVDAENAAAIAAYQRLGFRHHHTYGYLGPAV